MSIWAYIAVALYLIGFAEGFMLHYEDEDEEYINGRDHWLASFIAGALWPVFAIRGIILGYDR